MAGVGRMQLLFFAHETFCTTIVRTVLLRFDEAIQ
jgi:hypothetical protein